MRRFGMALAVGILVGGVAALVAGLMFEPFELIGTWGVVDGIVVGTIAFLVVLARGRGWLALLGRWLLVLALAFVSWWTMFFAIGTSPVSLEGAWLWPLALSCVSALAVAVRWAWRSSRRPVQTRPSLASK